jgi:hypothetical protein
MKFEFIYDWRNLNLLPAININWNNEYLIGKHFDIDISWLFFMISIGL